MSMTDETLSVTHVQAVDSNVGYLSVMLGDRAIAMHASWIREVCAVQPITRMPLSPPHVVGVFALRRKLIPLIDFALFVGDGPTAPVSRFSSPMCSSAWQI